MRKNTVVDLAGRETIADPLTEMLRTGARELIEKAVEVELQELLEQHGERRTEDGVKGGEKPDQRAEQNTATAAFGVRWSEGVGMRPGSVSAGNEGRA